MSIHFVRSGRRMAVLISCVILAITVAACSAGKPRATASPAVTPQRASVAIILNDQPAGSVGPRDLQGLPQLSIEGYSGPSLLSTLEVARIKDFKSLVVTGMAQNGKDLNAIGLSRQDVNDRVLLVLNPAGTVDLVRGGAPKDQWVYAVKRIEVDGSAEQQGPAYKLSIQVKGKELATFSIDDLGKLEQVTFDPNRGPTLSSVLSKAGVGGYSTVTIRGSSVGRAGAAEVTLTKAQVGDRVILDFTKRGTIKAASPDLPNTQWVLDVITIDVDSVAATPGSGSGSGAGTGSGGGAGAGGGGRK